MKKKQFFIESINHNGELFLWCVQYNREISLITSELFFHQLERLSQFTQDDFHFIPVVSHPIHGSIIKIQVSEKIAGQFYADLPNKRRSIIFQRMSVKFLLIDVFNDKEGYKEKIQHCSNSLIYLLEHYKSARIKQEFDNLEWGLDGTVN